MIIIWLTKYKYNAVVTWHSRIELTMRDNLRTCMTDYLNMKWVFGTYTLKLSFLYSAEIYFTAALKLHQVSLA